jgi:hypothetical protein
LARALFAAGLLVPIAVLVFVLTQEGEQHQVLLRGHWICLGRLHSDPGEVAPAQIGGSQLRVTPVSVRP